MVLLCFLSWTLMLLLLLLLGSSLPPAWSRQHPQSLR
jgi:hypothetical protein